MAKKKGLPEWAKRKAKAGSYEDQERQPERGHIGGLRVVPCDAVAKKLYLERRRSVRIVAKVLRKMDTHAKELRKIRPSKMSKTRQELLAAYSYAAGVLRELRGQIQG